MFKKAKAKLKSIGSKIGAGFKKLATGKSKISAFQAQKPGTQTVGSKIGQTVKQAVKNIASNIKAIAKGTPAQQGSAAAAVQKGLSKIKQFTKAVQKVGGKIAPVKVAKAAVPIPKVKPKAKAVIPPLPIVGQPSIPAGIPAPSIKPSVSAVLPTVPGEPVVPSAPPIPEPISKEFTEPKLEVPVTEEPVPEITPPPVEQLPETPVTPTPFGPSAYTGPSIVDYLASKGQQNSFSARRQLATQFDIQGYTGTAEQNTQLLNILRGQTGVPISTPTPTPTLEPTPTPEPTPEIPEPEPLTPIEEEYADFLKQKSYSEIYDELSESAGLNDMKDRLKEFEDKLQAVRDKIIAKKESINVNPWISESDRMRRISAAEATFAEEEGNAIEAWKQANKLYEDSVAEIQFRAKMAVQKQDEDRDFYFKVKEAARKAKEDALERAERKSAAETKLLSPTEAATLGVPYGTTRTQAAAMGITPSRYKPTTPKGGGTGRAPDTFFTQTQINKGSSVIGITPQKFNSLSYEARNALVNQSKQITATLEMINTIKTGKTRLSNFISDLNNQNIPSDLKSIFIQRAEASAPLEEKKSLWERIKAFFTKK